jgi:serine protease inhibitor
LIYVCIKYIIIKSIKSSFGENNMTLKQFLKTVFLTGLVLVLISLSVFSQAEKPGRPQKEPVAGAYLPAGTFDFDLFNAVCNAQPGSNVFISPFSVSLALVMTLNGAGGDTRDEIQRMLGYENIPLEKVDAAFENAIAALSDPESETILRIANSIWYRQGLTFDQTFLDTNRKYFKAEITGLDFSDPDAADIINRWVSANTNDKIKQIVTPPLDPSMVMYLINAVYFKGKWTMSFDKKKTRTAPFFVTPDKQSQCDLMYRRDNFNYFENDLLQAVDLPYGDGDFVMTILLPRDNVSISDVIMQLDASSARVWFTGMSKLEGNVYLPSFKTEYEITLNDILEKLGMPSAFEAGTADFSKIRPQNDLVISEVRHKTFVEVNEEGTEAAAVTSVGIALTSAMEPRTFTMRCDRPFIYLIREKNSETVLFMGLMINPAS